MKNNTTKKGKYPRRGENLNFELLNDLAYFRYIMQYAQDPRNGLDIQLRGNYLNIYYQGGSLLKLHIPTIRGRKAEPIQSDFFDEWYFYQQKETSPLKKTDIERLLSEDNYEFYKSLSEKSSHKYDRHRQIFNNYESLKREAKTIHVDINQSKANIFQELVSSKSYEVTAAILDKMKGTMTSWKNSLIENGGRKSDINERVIQHYISLFNKEYDANTDFIVLDLEYEISSLAQYRKEGIQPRMDIIAIEKGTGQLYVMELKYGMKSVKGEASAKDHYSDYLNTVGNDSKWEYFWDDINILLNAKKELEFFKDKDSITLRKAKPVFAFVLKIEEEGDEVAFKKQIQQESITSSVPIIILPKNPEENQLPQNYKLKIKAI